MPSKPFGLMFHHFHGHGHRPAEGALSAEDFEAVLDHFPGILPAREWAARARAGRLEADDVCLTFDDTLRSQADIALPIMRRRGLTGFWFVYSSVCEGTPERLEIYRYLRTHVFEDFPTFFAAFMAAVYASPRGAQAERQLRTFVPSAYLAQFRFYTDEERTYRFVRDVVLGPEDYALVMDGMVAEAGLGPASLLPRLWLGDDDLLDLDASGHVVGLHSHTHPTQLARLPVERQREEYARNQAHLTRLLGRPADTVAHPCNSYGPETLDILAGMGVTLGFCATPAGSGAPLEWPREDAGHLMIALGRRPALS